MSRYFNDFDAMHGESLEHHGVLGMKWGVRHYRNSDGTYNDKGKKRYGTKGKRTRRQAQRYLNDLSEERNSVFRSARLKYTAPYAGYMKKHGLKDAWIAEPDYKASPEYKKVKAEQSAALKEIAKTYNVSAKNKMYVDHMGSRTTAALGVALSAALIPIPQLGVPVAIGTGTGMLLSANRERKIENKDIGNSIEPKFKVRRRKQSK